MGNAVTRRLTRLAGVLMACVFLANVVAEIVRALRDAFNTDFLSSFYTAADMLRHGDHAIYCSGCLQAHAQHLFGTGAPIFSFQYDNPALGAWLLQPLTFLDPRAALGLFLGVSLLAVVIAAWLLVPTMRDSGRQALIAVAAFASLPAAMSFAYGQWDALLALAATGAYVALQRDRDVLAGLLLSILLLKPQLVWLVPVVVIIGGRWRVLFGIAAGAVVLAVSSVAVLGWSEAVRWLQQISPNIVARPGISLPHMLAAFGATPAMVVITSIVLAGGAMLALLARRTWLRSLPPTRLLSMGVLLSLLAAPHLLSYDLIIAAPVIVLWARDHERHALVSSLVLSAAFLVDLALPAGWGIVEAGALTGVVIAYLHQAGAFVASGRAQQKRSASLESREATS